jgi:hypothetical protein
MIALPGVRDTFLEVERCNIMGFLNFGADA